MGAEKAVSEGEVHFHSDNAFGGIEDAEIVQPKAQAAPWPERMSLRIICALVLLFPLFYGGKHDLALFVVQLVIFGFAAAASFSYFRGRVELLADFRLGSLSRRLLIFSGIFVMLAALQLLALPLGLLEYVSANAAALYSAAGATLGSVSIERAATLSGLVQFAAFAGCAFWIMALPYKKFSTSLSARPSRRRSRAKNQLLQRARSIDGVVDLLQRSIIFAGIACSLISLGHLALGGQALFGLFDPGRGGLRTSRAHWPFVNPNHLAVLIEIALMTAFARLLRLTQLTGLRSQTSGDGRRFTARFFQNPEKLGHHTSALLGVFVMLLCGILTLSRAGGTLIVLGMILLWFVFKSNQFEMGPRPVNSRRRRGGEPAAVRTLRKIAKPLSVLAVLLFILFFVGQTGGDKLLSRIEYGLTPNANQTRAELNYVSVDVLSDYPVLGVGLGNWHRGAAQHISRDLAGYKLDYAHNEFLQFAAEMGIVGSLLLFCFLGSLILLSRRALNKAHVASDKMLLWGSSAAIGLPLLHSLVEFPFHMPALALIFAVALAVHARLVDQALGS